MSARDRSTQSDAQIGRTMLVFNASEWVKAGYDQPEGNDRFWQPARIVDVIRGPGLLPDGTRELLAPVEWPDGRKSAGHFIHMMEEVRDDAA